jgi:hypothetical protein
MATPPRTQGKKIRQLTLAGTGKAWGRLDTQNNASMKQRIWIGFPEGADDEVEELGVAAAVRLAEVNATGT